MRSLTESLFRCLQPNTAPNGKPVFVEFKKDYLEKVVWAKSLEKCRECEEYKSMEYGVMEVWR